jgi:hypothetical protein
VVIIDPRFSSYGYDLIQNDPWLRGDVIRMVTHGPDADAAVMRRYFPDMRPVFADFHGTVWSSAPQATARVP